MCISILAEKFNTQVCNAENQVVPICCHFTETYSYDVVTSTNAVYTSGNPCTTL